MEWQSQNILKAVRSIRAEEIRKQKRTQQIKENRDRFNEEEEDYEFSDPFK